MKSLVDVEKYPLIGIAYSDYVKEFANKYEALIDYIEVPFELLKHDPSVFQITKIKPIILHCASLSIAGNVKPSIKTIAEIQYWEEKTKTPWIGEHMSFISGPNEENLKFADEYAPGEPYNIGYTMPPPLNKQAMETILEAMEVAESNFNSPVILENPPVYFTIPGSEMDQVSFISELAKQSNFGLLLDLAHFYITSRNEGFGPLERIDDLPLERVVEIHISGVEEQDGVYWDHHAAQAPELLYRLLKKVLSRVTPKAITLEYNWNSMFSESLLIQEIQKVKEVISKSYVE